MTISQQLKKKVEEAIAGGENRLSIAKRAGVEYRSFCRWLDEGRDIRASTIDSLGKALGVELAERKKK